VAEGQHGLARVGGPRLRKALGGVGKTLLVHPHQAGHVQQPGVIGKAFQGRSQGPVGTVGFPEPQRLVGLRQGLLDDGTGFQGDHDGTL